VGRGYAYTRSVLCKAHPDCDEILFVMYGDYRILGEKNNLNSDSPSPGSAPGLSRPFTTQPLAPNPVPISGNINPLQLPCSKISTYSRPSVDTDGLLDLGVHLDHLGVQLRLVTSHNLGVPAGSDKDGIDAT